MAKRKNEWVVGTFKLTRAEFGAAALMDMARGLVERHPSMTIGDLIRFVAEGDEGPIEMQLLAQKENQLLIVSSNEVATRTGIDQIT